MDKTRKYWFKRRRYGYGWVPATYEGWLVMAIYAVLVAVVVAAYATTPLENRSTLVFLVGLLTVTLCMICIAIAKGPQPRWRWGRKPSDNPNEDW